jgi:preprotein translocase subunit YajC
MHFLISDAMAQSGQSTGPGLGGLIFPIALIAIFYFMLIRPQQKRNKEHKRLVASLSKGDEVITNGGVLGLVTDVGDGYVSLEIANDVEIRIQKSAVTQVLPKGTFKQKLKKGEPAVAGKSKAESGKTNK